MNSKSERGSGSTIRFASQTKEKMKKRARERNCKESKIYQKSTAKINAQDHKQ